MPYFNIYAVKNESELLKLWWYYCLKC